jgi:hypothetical protein
MRHGIATAFGLTVSAVRHAGWWLEWHTRMAPRAGSRDLADVDLVPERCELS